MRWEELTGDAFPQAVAQAQEVCLLPLSCLERHGHHLPLGTDLFIARELCRRAAEIDPLELDSLIFAALEYAAQNQCSRLCVFSDSEVVVKQITGHYTCQSAALRTIHEMCKDLIQPLQEFTILHIRRQANSEADRLAY